MSAIPSDIALLLEKHDDGFLNAVGDLQEHEAATRLAEMWWADGSTWARGKLLAYLDRPLDSFGHEPLVKRLFKHAERDGDHEVMGAFLVAFDRLVRREWKPVHDWTNMTGGERIREKFVARPNRVPRTKRRVESLLGKSKLIVRGPKHARLFTHRTRYYLRRRAWRYFRRLAVLQPQEFVPAVSAALARYTDADLATGEAVLDSWALLRVAFGEHPSLEFTASHAFLLEGTRLADLIPAPSILKLWRLDNAFRHLMELVAAARSHFVRTWAIALAHKHHAARLKAMPVEVALKLAVASDQSVAELGLEALRSSPLTSSPEREYLPRFRFLTEAACEGAAEVIAAFALQGIARTAGRVEAGAARDDAKDALLAFLSSSNNSLRAAASNWIAAQASSEEFPFHDDPEFWRRSLELAAAGPRTRIAETLEQQNVAWKSVLAILSRGRSLTPSLIAQLRDSISHDESQAESLLPILERIAGGDRKPQRREAIAALVRIHAESRELQVPARCCLDRLGITLKRNPAALAEA